MHLSILEIRNTELGNKLLVTFKINNKDIKIYNIDIFDIGGYKGMNLKDKNHDLVGMQKRDRSTARLLLNCVLSVYRGESVDFSIDLGNFPDSIH